MQRMTGMLIGASFGVAFVLANAHEPLDPTLATILRVLAGIAFAAVVVMWFLAIQRLKRGAADSEAAQGMSFGRGYWLAVVAEVIAIFGGIAVIRALDRPEETIIAWIAFVVGVHFLPLAAVWKSRAILLPAIVLGLLGAIGLVMSFTPAVAWVPIVSGVLSGVASLAGTSISAQRELAALTLTPR